MSIVSFQNFFAIDHRVEVRINVTNVCNLHCDFCDHDAHLPFDRHGTRVFRRAPIVADIDAITDFCRAMVGVGERDAHVLQGGEITALPIRTVVEYIDVLHSFGRRVGMRSNGYRLASIPLDSLNRLDFIYLNAHGNNQSAIEHCQKFLSQHYRGRVILEESFFHRNPADFLHHGLGTPSQGMNCSHMMSTLTVMPPVVHPCCNSWALMNALNASEMKESLLASGWTCDNPDLRSTLARWRDTLPPPFLESFCADSCYRTAPALSPPWTRIQPHPLDKVLKMGKREDSSNAKP